MNKGVASFSINHDKLLEGIYVSRKDTVGGETVTTFDIRMKKPNIEPALDLASVHTIEHIMAVYLRTKSSFADKILYVGPMGCRTGMYLIIIGDYNSVDILPLMKEVFEHIASFEGEIPATKSKECGNYLDHNLEYAKYDAKKYLQILNNAKDENLSYPK